MRPLSFTKNIGGLDKVFHAIRRGFAPGVSVDKFRLRCGLNSSLSLLVVEFFLSTQSRSGKEFITADTLIEQTLARPKFDLTLARLYFFALNLAMPGERLRPEQRNAGQLQRHVIKEHIYINGSWRITRIEKDASLEPFVRNASNFQSVRKWVNNYWFMLNQCKFVTRPDGGIETFPDTWGHLALILFFERYSVLNPLYDVDKLIQASFYQHIYELLGVPSSWLAQRVEGAADMFLKREFFNFEIFIESNEERKAIKNGKSPPRPEPGSMAQRRAAMVDQIIRRGENRRFIQGLYNGLCQISGVILRLPNEKFTVDCAHIRPLGNPHRGPDDVKNMLSLSPTMHRMLDRGCIYIDPSNLSIMLLHENNLPHLPQLLVRKGHGLSAKYIAYFNKNILK